VSVAQTLGERIKSRDAAELDGSANRWPVLAGQAITLIVNDGAQHGEVTWTFPPSAAGNGQAAGATEPIDAAEGEGAEQLDHPTGPGVPPVATMIADSDVWLALLDGRANMITEIRNGRLRCVNSRDAHRVRSDEVHALAWLLGIAQVPLVHQPG
jgi:hypothetical protein